MKETDENPILNEKLWIGNLDPRITEYQLLKLVQTHGTIEKFDLIFHRSGPLAGQPRGYAFVTYLKKVDAVTAKNDLNGKLVGQKRITVTWAHSAEVDTSYNLRSKPDVVIPALTLSKDATKADPVSQIQAIEEKLKLMEQKDDELKINDSVAMKPPVIQQFQFNKDRSNSLKTKPLSLRIHDRHRKPYIKRKSNF